MLILFKKAISFFILLLIGFIFYKKVVKKENLFFSKRNREKQKKEENIEKMEKDPICSTYVPVKSSLKIKFEGKMYYFCSEKCREKYISKLNK